MTRNFLTIPLFSCFCVAAMTATPSFSQVPQDRTELLAHWGTSENRYPLLRLERLGLVDHLGPSAPMVMDLDRRVLTGRDAGYTFPDKPKPQVKSILKEIAELRSRFIKLEEEVLVPRNRLKPTEASESNGQN